jgi:hypothetical protein
MEALIQQFAPCFTQPSFQTFCVIATGWPLGGGRRTVTRILRAGGGLDVKSFSCFHRFFSQARWSPDLIGHVILLLLLKFIDPNAAIVVAIDDTLTRKTGKNIWGAAMHHDPLLSTGNRPFFSFGHNFVVLSVQIQFSFAPNKIWSLTILTRLYRRKLKKGKVRGERKAIGQASAQE